jgi:hypothetical protein
MPLVDMGSHLGGYLMGMLVVAACEANRASDEKSIPPTSTWRFVQLGIFAAVPMFPIAGLTVAMALAEN